jgi:hypothetical protein
MAQLALLIGIKDQAVTLIQSGDPREIRLKFKHAKDGEGFDEWQVFESTVGRSRRKRFSDASPQPQAQPEPEPEQQPELESDEDDDPASEPVEENKPRRGRPPKVS